MCLEPKGFWTRVCACLGPGLLVGAVLFWHARSYLPFMADDAFISLRYADRLLAGDGLTWSDGPRVEGYSNLLWILLCAAVGTLTDLVTASRVVGGACAAVVVATFAWTARGSWQEVTSSAVASLALVLTGPFAVWTVGGLEQPLLAAGLSVALAGLLNAAEAPQALHRLWVPGAALATCVLTRPDSPIFVGCAWLSLLGSHGIRSMRAATLRLLCLPAVAFAGQLLFRLGYYGEWVPNPARLKTALTAARLEDGLHYLRDAQGVLAPLLIAGGLTLLPRLATAAGRRTLAITLLPALAWPTYVVAIGGDIFPGRRHLVALLTILAWQVYVGLVSLLRGSTRAKLVAGVLSVGLVGSSAALGTKDPRSLDARGELWEWDAASTGPFFERAFSPERPLIAIDAAGALGFFSRLPAIDMLGLNDLDIPRRLPPTWGRGRLSWELHDVGNADSVLERQPDLIVPCGPSGSAIACPSVPWTFRLFAHPIFQRDYVPVAFLAEHPKPVSGTIWLRRASRSASGVQGEQLRVRAPLLCRDGGVLRVSGGEALAHLAPGQKTEIPLDGGPYEVGAIEGVGLNDGTVGAAVAGQTLTVINHSSTTQKVRAIVLVRR